MTASIAALLLGLSQDVGALRAAIEVRVAVVPGAEVGVTFRDLGTGDSLSLSGDVVFHAASLMKVPVMFELVAQEDDGSFGLDQPLLLVNQFASIVDGSPYALDPESDEDPSLYDRVGGRVPIRELMTRMIVRSSNLATNALIALVGAERVTARARALGASRTAVLRGVEDTKAFERGLNNRTTAADMAQLLVALERGEVSNATGTAVMRDILLRQEFEAEIPAGLPAGTPVAHKTGQITGVLHDAAIVYPRDRSPYVLAVLTRGIPDEAIARALIADVSRLVYAHVAAGHAATRSH